IVVTTAAIVFHIESSVVILKRLHWSAKPAVGAVVEAWWFTPGQVTGEHVCYVLGSWVERFGL
ncbi:MAG: hypothetical protein QGG00_02680, partial [Verrucomicrobiota bacterium]|nr:hypothetical protein [Verrucomicrobiota bacterium]